MGSQKQSHRVIRVDNLMYKGCEPHWKCVHCGVCIPFHCYTKSNIEEKECAANALKGEHHAINQTNTACGEWDGHE